jgi:hypothetical protein
LANNITYKSTNLVPILPKVTHIGLQIFVITNIGLQIFVITNICNYKYLCNLHSLYFCYF